MLRTDTARVGDSVACVAYVGELSTYTLGLSVTYNTIAYS